LIYLTKMEGHNLGARVSCKFVGHQGSVCHGTSREIESASPTKATALAPEARAHFSSSDTAASLLTVELEIAVPCDSSKASLPKLEEKVPTRMLHLKRVKKEGTG
jgi:hypothetical protein